MAHSLQYKYTVKPVLNKIALYEENDFFSEHIDSPHHLDMKFTLAISLPVNMEDVYGGNLILGKEIKRVIGHPEKQ